MVSDKLLRLCLSWVRFVKRVKTEYTRKMRNTIKLLKIADRAYKMEIAKTAANKRKLKISLKRCFRTVIIEYKTKGTLNAIEAAVIFLFPATPLRLIEIKVLFSNCVNKSLYRESNSKAKNPMKTLLMKIILFSRLWSNKKQKNIAKNVFPNLGRFRRVSVGFMA